MATVRLQCPQCGHVFRIYGEAGAYERQCPECQGTVKAPINILWLPNSVGGYEQEAWEPD